MCNEFYFQINVADEQIELARRLVEHSLEKHPVKNIWHSDTYREANTNEYRFTGTLGEVLFADVYGLKRPERSFGAVDGQDFGKDFSLQMGDKSQNIDVKTMRRKTGSFYKDYVLNIPSSQLHKSKGITQTYYCISLHQRDSNWIASFLGYIDKQAIIDGKVGILYRAGNIRLRHDNTTFQFLEDTYEIDFGDICTPILTENVHRTKGFKILKLK